MPQVVIENPVINSPFEEPQRHFRFTNEGITNEIVPERRVSSYFIPIAKPKKKGKQLTSRTRNGPRSASRRTRTSTGFAPGWPCGGKAATWETTKTTARLLEYWQRPDREKKLFFCQIEALETPIYITEVAKKYGDAWIENDLRDGQRRSQPRPFPHRLQDGHRQRQDRGHGDAHRLAHPQQAGQPPGRQVLPTPSWLSPPASPSATGCGCCCPIDPGQLLPQMGLVPPDLQAELCKAKILITNFHAFLLREKVAAGKLTKTILAQGGRQPFTETPDQMVRRVCRELGNKKNIIVINDEAHHCYRRKPDGLEEKLTGDERKEAEKREEAARVWISGLEAVQAKMGIKAVYDLSATPFFLRGSGYSEGTLFPWVVSDFSLIDAIECGIVKVPRVPVADDSMVGEQPTYRDLWLRIRDHLPKKGRKTEAVSGEPKLPAELEGALHSLYSQLREVLPAVGAERRGPGQGPDAAGLHRGLQQHQRLQAGFRLHRRLGKAPARRHHRRGARQLGHLQQRRRRQMADRGPIPS